MQLGAHPHSRTLTTLSPHEPKSALTTRLPDTPQKECQYFKEFSEYLIKLGVPGKLVQHDNDGQGRGWGGRGHYKGQRRGFVSCDRIQSKQPSLVFQISSLEPQSSGQP